MLGSLKGSRRNWISDVRSKHEIRIERFGWVIKCVECREIDVCDCEKVFDVMFPKARCYFENRIDSLAWKSVSFVDFDVIFKNFEKQLTFRLTVCYRHWSKKILNFPTITINLTNFEFLHFQISHKSTNPMNFKFLCFCISCKF